MAAGQRRPYLLAYDIADPKRLTRVHHTVRAQGLPLQYSVFLLYGTAADVDRLLADLDRIIHPKADDIRVYPLPEQLDAYHYGRQWLPGLPSADGGTSLQDALIAFAAEQDKAGADSSSKGRRRRRR